MEYRQLGRSSLNSSRIIFGAWAIGGWMWGKTDEKESIEAIQTALRSGINTIDTAAIYGMGLSEKLVAKAIQSFKRDQVVIATKCGLRWDKEGGSDPWHTQDEKGKPVTIWKNSNPKSIAFECEESLKRLQTDYIDLYQIHWVDSSVPIHESWEEMAKLKKEGKVKAIGVSNYTLEQLKEAHAHSPVDTIQPPYSLLRRGIEKDIVPFCQEKQISILAYSPLERGLLTGKVTMDRKFSEGDHRKYHPLFTQENRKRILDVLKEIEPIAKKHKATLSQLILQCTLQVGAVDAVIVGARNSSQAKENAETASLKLTDEERMRVIDLLNTHSPLES